MKDEVLTAALAGLLHDVDKFAQRAGESVSAGMFYQRPREGAVIQAADYLAAGVRHSAERDDGNRQLQSIFSAVFEHGQNMPDKKCLPLESLKLERGIIFPNLPLQSDADVLNQYKKLWGAFCAEAESLKKAHEPKGDLESYLESMLSLMQRYTWCVPSADADVSLYDHSRMTAALAAALNELPEDKLKALAENSGVSADPIALLIGGDISGIQKFIYTITSKKAAQTLRGRSFYLQLLTEAVLRFVLNQLELPYTSVIYSGGGHFFLLAPMSAKGKLANIRGEITKKILAHHGTNLYFALGYTEVPASGFEAGKFPEYWNKMHADLGIVKQRRYAELGAELHERIFAVPASGGNPDDTCSVCGDDTRKTRLFDDDNETQSQICSLCDSFWDDIGQELPRSDFVALGWQKPQDTEPGTALDALKSFGLRIRLLENEKGKAELEGVERITLWALDDPKNGFPKPGKIPASNLLHYTVNDIPSMTFDEMQDKVENGFQRLGVLRMDEDNLGDVFKKGLGDYATLARISTLSFQMSLFFEGWIKRICDMQGFKGKIYAVYAGGDDVFLIGPWDVMPELALKIRDDFAKYTANHPDLHISAGLAFIGGKYPIYQAADDAEVILKSAKKNDGKDSFGFIGNAWTWKEFTEVQGKFSRIVRIVEDLKGPHAIIQNLRELAEMKVKRSEKSKNKKEVWGPWQWRGAYVLKRMEEREKKNPVLADEIAAISKDLEPNYVNINQWGAAARWAQLKTRKKVRKDDDELA